PCAQPKSWLHETANARARPAHLNAMVVWLPVDDQCEEAFAACTGRNTLPAASRNQPRKMYHEELSEMMPGIGSPIGIDASTPMMARHPAMTKSATLGACSSMEASLNDFTQASRTGVTA